MFDLQRPNGSFEDALKYRPITQIFDESGTVDWKLIYPLAALII